MEFLWNSGLIAVPAAVQAASAFTFKITVWALDAQPDMDNMKVKVTVDGGKTKSKNVNIGKIVDKKESPDVPVAKFEFKNVHKGQHYVACITGLGVDQCHDGTIKSKKVTEKIAIGFWD